MGRGPLGSWDRCPCDTEHMEPIDPELLKHATGPELAALELALEAEIALSSPADYAVAVSGGRFQRPPHIDLISRTVQQLIDGTLLKPSGTPYRRLMVAMPPRHGKSEMISKYMPAWMLTKWPDRKIAVASYEADFAASWGRKARDVLLEAPRGLAPKLRRDTTAASRWDLVKGGGMFTAGVGGPITGKGFQVIVLDDVLKNWQDAQSETVRETIWNWYLSTVVTRIEPIQHADHTWGDPGVVILVTTRWHEDDLAGRLLHQEPEDWYQISLPAIAGPADPLGRLPGQALWPERYDLKSLSAIRESLGPQLFAALYQQNPYVEGGGIFRLDKARYFTRHESDKGNYIRLIQPDSDSKVVPEAQLAKFMTVDLAATTKTTSDYSVFALWGVTPDTTESEDARALVLLDIFRDRIEGADHMSTLERLYGAWKPRFVGIERATYGLTLLQTAARTGRIPVRELKPDFDKVSRAYSAGALMEAGRMYFPKQAPWLELWLNELVAFPQGRHDDCVDVTAYAALVLSERLHAARKPKDPKPVTTEEKIRARLSGKKDRDRLHPILGRF